MTTLLQIRPRILPFLLLVVSGHTVLFADPGAAQSLLIRGARVVDGTGAPGRSASVRVDGGYIAAVGSLDARSGEDVIDATGLVLAPGFIDTHSHHDRGLLETPEALGAVSQGITTIVVGQDGGSRLPLSRFMDEVRERPTAVNVASYVGHGTLRREVLGANWRREATPAEIDTMKRLLRREMAAGALGLSTGLEYDPGIHASTDEVIALASEAARMGGRYMTHMRSEDRELHAAVDETLRIGRETGIPVHISHMKLAMRSLWGEAGRLLRRLEEARRDGVEVTADVYPYTFWQSTMTVLFPDRDFDDREAFEFALDELVPPEGMLIGRYEPRPEYEGRTLAEIAEVRGESPVDTYMALVAEVVATDAGESIVATSMAEEDVIDLVRWEHTNISTDGALRGAHPRGFGAFTRVLGPWVRAGHLSLEEAVHKATGLAARHAGIPDRGVIRVGVPADLVLFDPVTVGDRATRQEPHRVSEGIEGVWVNGVRVYEGGGRTTGIRPGRVLTRPGLSTTSAVGDGARWLARGRLTDSATAAIDEIFAMYDDTRSPGCAVGVVRGDRLTFARGYGMADLEHGVPLGPESVFRIGSVSKQFTAAAVVLLAVEGTISLDDPVTRWVPELPDYGPELTVRRLLHHTSGVRDYLTLTRLAGYRDFDWYDDEDLLAMLARQRETNFPPGSEYLYSNSGYWLLSEIVKRATGRSLADFAEDRFFDPLGMDATHFHDDATRIVPRRAVGYAPTEEGYRISTTTLPMIGDGGVFTSVEEMALWARQLADPSVAGPAWLDLMLTRGVLTSGDTLDYAMGLQHDVHRGLPTVGHGGSFVGYRADLTRFPDQDLTVTTLCNRSDARPSALSLQVADVLLADAMDPAPPPEEAPAREGPGEDTPVVELSPEQLDRWAGSFRSDELDVIYDLRREEGEIVLLMGGRAETRLTPVAEDVLSGGGLRLRAITSGNERVEAFVVEAGRVTNLSFERVGDD